MFYFHCPPLLTCPQPLLGPQVFLFFLLWAQWSSVWPSFLSRFSFADLQGAPCLSFSSHLNPHLCLPKAALAGGSLGQDWAKKGGEQVGPRDREEGGLVSQEVAGDGRGCHGC